LSTAGLQCFDDGGNLTFTTGDGLARIVKTGMTGGAGNGALYVPEWEPALGNRPWFCTVNPAGFNTLYIQPGFNIAMPNLAWFVGYPGIYPNIKMICGIY
jgi:hypothetical protein